MMQQIVEEACIRLILVELLESNKWIEDTMTGIYFNIVSEVFGPSNNSKSFDPDIDRETLIEKLRWSVAKRQAQRLYDVEILEAEVLKQEHTPCLCCECDPCDCD